MKTHRRQPGPLNPRRMAPVQKVNPLGIAYAASLALEASLPSLDESLLVGGTNSQRKRREHP